MMNALILLKKYLQGIFPAKTSSRMLQTIVNPSERISRFILNSKHISSSGHPKSAVFIPSKRTKDISVYRTSDVPEVEIWDIASQYVEKLREDQKKVLARADLPAKNYFDASLQFDPNGYPHKLHANVINWPSEEMEIKRMSVEFANKAILVKRQSGYS